MALLFWFYVLLVLWFLGASFSLMYYSTQLDKCWYGDWIYIGLVAQTSHCFIGRFMKVQPVDSEAGTEISADPPLPTQHIISVPPRVYIYCPNVTRNLLNLSFKSQKAKISLFQSPIPVVTCWGYLPVGRALHTPLIISTGLLIKTLIICYQLGQQWISQVQAQGFYHIGQQYNFYN